MTQTVDHVARTRAANKARKLRRDIADALITLYAIARIEHLDTLDNIGATYKITADDLRAAKARKAAP